MKFDIACKALNSLVANNIEIKSVAITVTSIRLTGDEFSVRKASKVLQQIGFEEESQTQHVATSCYSIYLSAP